MKPTGYGMRETLEWAKTFIEYARYELEPGKAELGSQFPKQDDADEIIERIKTALQLDAELRQP